MTGPGEMSEREDRCGYVAITGRPNVGKSTLINRLVGARLAAVTEKPQTTRNRLLAIKSTPEAQMVFIDTPGVHDARSPMNLRMVEAAKRASLDADVTVILVEAGERIGPTNERTTKEIVSQRPERGSLILALNKIDRVPRVALLEMLQAASQLVEEAEVIPISATTGENVEELERLIVSVLPVGPRLFPDDQLTDQSERFWAQEIIRENLMTVTRQELPYETAVLVEGYREERDRNLLVISATVLVERPTQKAIIIGQGGQQIKRIGKQAREDLERQFGRRVFLDLHVKVHKRWSRDPRVLRELGI